MPGRRASRRPKDVALHASRNPKEVEACKSIRPDAAEASDGTLDVGQPKTLTDVMRIMMEQSVVNFMDKWNACFDYDIKNMSDEVVWTVIDHVSKILENTEELCDMACSRDVADFSQITIIEKIDFLEYLTDDESWGRTLWEYLHNRDADYGFKGDSYDDEGKEGDSYDDEGKEGDSDDDEGKEGDSDDDEGKEGECDEEEGEIYYTENIFHMLSQFQKYSEMSDEYMSLKQKQMSNSIDQSSENIQKHVQILFALKAIYAYQFYRLHLTNYHETSTTKIYHFFFTFLFKKLLKLCNMVFTRNDKTDKYFTYFNIHLDPTCDEMIKLKQLKDAAFECLFLNRRLALNRDSLSIVRNVSNQLTKSSSSPLLLNEDVRTQLCSESLVILDQIVNIMNKSL